MMTVVQLNKTLTRLATCAAVACAVVTCGASTAGAIDIEGVREASLDQPRVNALIQPADGSDPYTYEGLFTDQSFNLFVFLDTGASGIIMSQDSAQTLGLPTEPGVTYADIGVGGTTDFDVSQPLTVRMAPYTELDVDNMATYQTAYNQAVSSVRLEIGPTNVTPDPLSDPLDVFGMPVMMGKTVVMDPTPVNDLSDLMHTFIYDPGTPFNPAAVDTNPGIPTTNHHVQLSYADFSRFNEVTPPGSPVPVIAHNPFIGPDPTLQLEDSPTADDTPPVDVSFGGLHASGSFLLDTGAAVSFISNDLAGQLDVRYVDGSILSGDPQLEVFDPDHPELPGTPIGDQFQVPIQGIGGTVNLSGFFLDDMLLHTLEGSLLPDDPNNIRFLGAPVVVNDIEVVDPLTDQSLILDGVFGMNFMSASIALDLGDARESPFRWVTFDEPNGILGLDLVGGTVPEPGTCVLAGTGLLLLAGGPPPPEPG